jgi:hypothetical protein
MTHNELNLGMMRALMDSAVAPEEAQEIAEHLNECAICRGEFQNLKTREATTRGAMNELPSAPCDMNDLRRGWMAFERKRDTVASPRRTWSTVKTWWLAAGLAPAMFVIMLCVGPVRVWAQNFLEMFRVERFTVLEVSPEVGASLQNNQMLNQAISHMLSDQVRVTQAPQPPQPLDGEVAARKLAGFDVRLVPGLTPTKMLLEGGAAAQLVLNRERLQSILDEAGRTDLQIPASIDGAEVSFRLAPGVMTTYAQCANGQMHPRASGQCITLMQVPSPIVTAPRGFDPAQLAQVGLQFLGMSASDASSFTQTVDWTSTLVVPVIPGRMSYRRVLIDGREGILLRPADSATIERYTLTWVNNGIVYVIESYGDDSAALALAEELT